MQYIPLLILNPFPFVLGGFFLPTELFIYVWAIFSIPYAFILTKLWGGIKKRNTFAIIASILLAITHIVVGVGFFFALLMSGLSF